MPETNNQLVIVIISVILILLFFGVVFLIMISYYNNRKLRASKEKQLLKDNFERQLLHSRLEIQDQIFNSISQEIHDNVGQNLSLAKVQVNIIDQRGVFSSEGLAEVKESIGRALADLRDIAKSLSSQRIQQVKFNELVDTELQRIKKTGLVTTSLTIHGAGMELAFKDKLILFRMVQESLQNIVKHAAASEVTISIRYEDKQLHIVISDNGKGFDFKNEIVGGNGLGLQNIINRATMIGGKATINSAVNEGTHIDIYIPYEQ